MLCTQGRPTGHKLNWCTHEVTANRTLDIIGNKNLMVVTPSVADREWWKVRWFGSDLYNTASGRPVCICSTSSLQLHIEVTDVAATFFIPVTKGNVLWLYSFWAKAL